MSETTTGNAWTVEPTLNRFSTAVIALFIGMQLAALGILDGGAMGIYTESEVISPATSSSSGVGIIGLIIAESVVLLLCWKGYQKLPRKWQARVKVGLRGLLTLVAIGWLYFGLAYNVLAYVPIAVSTLLYLASVWIPETPYYWLYHNLMAVLSGIGGIAAAVWFLPPSGVIVLTILAILWDALAVFKSDIMAGLAGVTGSARLPAFIAIPDTWHLSQSTLFSFTDGEKADNFVLLGLGDFVIPSLLPVSLMVAGGVGSWPVVGAIAGICVSVTILSGLLEYDTGMLPALLWLNSGALIGSGIGSTIALVQAGTII